MTPEEFPAAAHVLVDWIADHRERVPDLPVAARVKPGDVAAGGGLQAEPAPLVVYTSPHAHSSVAKAALLAGFGQDNLRYVDVDPVTYALRPDALARTMEADRAAGRRPAAVVLSVGTTGTTAVDPIADVLPITARHRAWVHVDAAMAGAALLLPETAPLVAGIEGDRDVEGSAAIP